MDVLIRSVIRRYALIHLIRSIFSTSIFLQAPESNIEPVMDRRAESNDAQKFTDNNPGSTIDSPATKITDFELIKKLGEGTFGQVYLAVHKRTGSRHAIKIIEKRNMNVQGLDSMFKEQGIQRDIGKVYAGQFCLPLDASFHDSHYFYMVSVSNCTFLKQEDEFRF